MEILTNAIQKLPEYRTVSDAVGSKRLPACITGLAGIHKAHIVSALCEENKKRALIIAGDESEAQRLENDLQALGLRTAFYPYRDFSFRNMESHSHEYEQQRLGVLSQWLGGQCDVILCCVDGCLQYTMPPAELKRRVIKLHSGDKVSPTVLVGLLTSSGYERVAQVESIGQYAMRGGIIDIFVPGEAAPVRVEFWDDEIDTLSYFDVEGQRRTDRTECLTVTPSAEVPLGDAEEFALELEAVARSLKGKSAENAKTHLQEEADHLRSTKTLSCADKYISLIFPATACLFDYIGADDLIFVSEYNKVKERYRAVSFQTQEDIKGLLEEGVLCKGLDTFSRDWSYLLEKWEDGQTVYLENFAHGGFETPVRVLTNFTARQLSVWGGGLQLLQEDLDSILAKHWSCVVLAGTEKAARVLLEELEKEGYRAVYDPSPRDPIADTVIIMPGGLSSGIEYPALGFSLITHGIQTQKHTKRRKIKQGQDIQSLSELKFGDLVVHSIHGIGIFEGIHKMEMQGIAKDYIKIRYAKQDILYVPVTQLDLVAKYIGSHEENESVKLHSLGGTEWQKTKARVRKAVKDIAKELIALYAKRLKSPGHAFPEDTEWQRDFEAKFEFQETEDQLRCIDEIKNDMMQTAPMDRLLCGDVGFGKTEVALRAAFKCVTDGMQCVILVPTTILAWQHYQTILRRMEGFPITVGLLSRFRSQKQQDETISKLRRGEIDIAIGTHRLIQKDVSFRNPGLVIIDEEQRFGVAQKEKLKSLYPNVDTLTLSATPIPRTLNMAMSGIRDMSVIEEAPQDRHPVQTYVMEYDQGIIVDAIRRELRRGGQVYYLHNRVENIEQVAGRLQQAIPECTVGVAHGKMGEEALSEIWGKLLEHEIDVLVCTTIIETGVDVPNCNTLIIDNADCMGLSQLHQLRGRVGRSSRRAYAYLTFTRGKALSEISQKRLDAIREFTEFGSGFQIAMRDLEIRGAGNVLGAQQHGHMEAVGYDMYLKLLGDAISEEKGEISVSSEVECLVDVQIQAHIPEKYIEDFHQRLDIYRRIADIRTEEDAMDTMDELIDRFGEPPAAVKGLIDVALLRNKASALGISEIKQNAGALLLYQNPICKEHIVRLSAKMRGNIMANAGNKPHIVVRISNTKNILDNLKSILDIMAAEGEQEKTKN